MKSLKRLIAIAVASSLCSLAHAAATYEARFSLPEGQLPHLRTHLDHIIGGSTLPGEWSPGANHDARVVVREVTGQNVDPVTGAVTTTWGDSFYDSNRDRGGVAPLSMGDTKAFARPGAFLESTEAGAFVGTGSMTSQVKIGTREAEAVASTAFAKNFSIDANSSFTFSGISTLSITGDAAPVDARTRFDLDASGSFASLTMADAADRLWTRIGASVTGVVGSLAGIFSYDVGPGGLLSLTITNNSNTALFGQVNASTFVGVAPSLAAPVPEPEALLLMGAGVAVLGFAKRKQGASKQAIPA